MSIYKVDTKQFTNTNRLMKKETGHGGSFQNGEPRTANRFTNRLKFNIGLLNIIAKIFWYYYFLLYLFREIIDRVDFYFLLTNGLFFNQNLQGFSANSSA